MSVKDSDKCRSWFLVLNNPAESIGNLQPREMCDRVVSMWVSDEPTRSCACLYCISAQGLHHLHIVCEDSRQVRFSTLKKTFPRAHIEATLGTKKQVMDYVKKQGVFEEKGEEVIYITQVGEIEGRQGKNQDLAELQSFIEQGLKPSEIMALKFSYRKYEKMIRDAYFDKRKKDTPLLRDVKVIWHVGESGSGKTYSYIKACEIYGEDEVYLVTDYDSGGLDKYCGEKCLFLDEFRGQIRYSTLLSMLQGYKQQFHARYTNVYGLWTEVHIVTVMPPELVYKNMVSANQDVDTFAQLRRRISIIVYHYRESEEFKEFSIPFAQYTTFDALKRACGQDFIKVNDGANVPF